MQFSAEKRKMLGEIRGLTFDLWGTLLDDAHPPADTVKRSKDRQDFLQQELNRLGVVKSEEEISAAYMHAWHYFDELWLKQIAFGAAEGVTAMLSFLQVELPSQSLLRVIEYFENFRDPPGLLEGAQAAIQGLARFYPLALISDTAWTPGRILRQLLAGYQILDCFRVLVFSGEVGHTKPHPLLFQLALEGLALEAGKCLHVGDLQRTDVAGDKALGMRAAWIERPVYAGGRQDNHSPDLVVASVAELAQLLLDQQ